MAEEVNVFTGILPPGVAELLQEIPEPLQLLVLIGVVAVIVYPRLQSLWEGFRHGSFELNRLQRELEVEKLRLEIALLRRQIGETTPPPASDGDAPFEMPLDMNAEPLQQPPPPPAPTGEPATEATPASQPRDATARGGSWPDSPGLRRQLPWLALGALLTSALCGIAIYEGQLAPTLSMVLSFTVAGSLIGLIFRPRSPLTSLLAGASGVFVGIIALGAAVS